MQVQNWKCCHIKLWRIIKVSSVSRAFNIIWIQFYCGLYTMAIDVVTWRIIKKWCIWSLHVNFSGSSLLRYFFKNYERCHAIILISYIYPKLKLGTEKCICLKWVFLPQWSQRVCQWTCKTFRGMNVPWLLYYTIHIANCLF